MGIEACVLLMQRLLVQESWRKEVETVNVCRYPWLIWARLLFVSEEAVRRSRIHLMSIPPLTNAVVGVVGEDHGLADHLFA